MENRVLSAIRDRRSVRHYTDEQVPADDLNRIIEAGIWAPSGLNNQPWRFVVIQDADKREELARLDKNNSIIRGAPVCVAVFLDKDSSYHYVKDVQAVGACIQNMLLAAHALGYGSVWLGRILDSAEPIRELFALPPHMELMAVIAIGRSGRTGQSSQRRPLAEFILGNW
jgi:nitroreductase